MTTSTAEQALIWEAERPRLTGLAYRILGSWHDAEDVVAQSWPRFAEASQLDRPAAWLTTVVTRLAIDTGRRARTRRESYTGPWLPEPVATDRLPHEVAETRSLLGLGILRPMEALDPEERAIFVLREAFEVPYAEIADCVGRSPAACRQAVSRARAALHTSPGAQHLQSARQGAIHEPAVLTALVNAVSLGDLAEIVRLVSDDCVLWADGGGTVRAALHPVRGRERVTAFLTSVARLAVTVTSQHVNGVPALLFTNDLGRYLYVLEHDGTHITGIQVHANPAKLQAITNPQNDSERGTGRRSGALWGDGACRFMPRPDDL